jgi:hypothetical protein
MRSANIYNNSFEHPLYKTQIMSAPKNTNFLTAQERRPFVKNGKLHSHFHSFLSLAGGTGSWPGDSVDVTILAMQSLLLALDEDAKFIQLLKQVLKVGEGKSVRSGRVQPSTLRKVWARLYPDEQQRIRHKVTSLACFTAGNKTDIGALAKLFEAQLFGSDEQINGFI